MADWISPLPAVALTSTVYRFRFVAAAGSVIRVRFKLARDTWMLSTIFVCGAVQTDSIPIKLGVVN